MRAFRSIIRLALLSAAWLFFATTAQAQEEVPFITTPDNVTKAMLELAKVGPGDRVIDLGSGDGRIVITAARMGATGLGVEIVPDLVAKSRDNARRAGVADRVEFRQQDLFETSLEAFTVVTMYLLPELNLKLRARLLAMPAGTRVVSHDWDMGDWRPDRSIDIDVPDKAIGREKRSRVHLWIVPAKVQGTWCAKGTTLRIEQRFQAFSATLVPPKRGDAEALVFDGRFDAGADGTLMRAHGAVAAMEMRWTRAGIRVVAAQAPAAKDVDGATFVPAAGPRCEG